MISKTRTNFIDIVTADGVQEKDINSMQWEKFVTNRPLSYYKLSYADLQRPDLICQKVYGSQQYFWVLMKFNEIDDIWNDIKVDDVLMCPNALDIDQFFSIANTYG